MTEKSSIDISAAGGFNNERRAALLAVIDELRELGIGDDNISLPQLVVVGDQSSGKSSLLEALTGLSFPIASDLCTRFVTQIVLRRASVEKAEVKTTIIPRPGSSKDVCEKLTSFNRNIPMGDFDTQDFGKVFDEAAALMGIPGPNTTELENLDKRFSDDILKIELSGPDHHHLSFVDVPGLFHNATPYQTEEDREIIRKLIEKYLNDKRTIILAVMDAVNNLANQEVFSMARTADPDGKRTVGIITKCDALQDGDEMRVLRIAQNQVERLAHGWFVVRNRSTKEIAEGVTIQARHEKERRFFDTVQPWATLRKNQVGVLALTPFLGHLLYGHIRSQFPSLVDDIESRLSQERKELEMLGPSRQQSFEQRQFLTRIATTYQDEVEKALGGNYDALLKRRSGLKLRMHLRDLNDRFANEMSQRGQLKAFHEPGDSVDTDAPQPELSGHESADGKNDDGLTGRENDDDTQTDIYSWIRDCYRASRGSELPGTVNPRILETLFRQLSSPWEAIAKNYIQNSANAVCTYNRQILDTVVYDEDVRSAISRILRTQEQQSNAQVFEQLTNILNDERRGILQTVNHYFSDTLNSIREKRLRERLNSLTNPTGLTGMSVPTVMKAVHLSNEDQAVYDIHDTLKAYYKVALKRFMDNVIIQVTERHLLGNGGPVKTLTPELIGGMSETRLAEIAGENLAIANARAELEVKVARMQEAFEKARAVGI